jgi:sugar phosphate isomerase/epimerase
VERYYFQYVDRSIHHILFAVEDKLDFSVASWSFHRLLEAGKQDMFQYIVDCKDLGCTQLDPWNGHLASLVQEDKALKAGSNPLQPSFSPESLAYVAEVKAAAGSAGMPFSCLAVDGAYVYEPTPELRQINRAAAYRWLDIARQLGASQMRVDSGGTADLPDDMFEIIVEGLQDIVQHGREFGVEVVIENHWGASNVPDNVIRMIKAVDGLGLLFDSGNFAPGTQEQGWTLCTPYARSVHIKTFAFDSDGNETTVDIPRLIRMLVEAGYKGCWGVESVPEEGDEIAVARMSLDLIRRTLAAL